MSVVDDAAASPSPGPDQPGHPQDDPSILSSLKPPPAVAIVVRGLSIQAPVPELTIPLAVPIKVPRFIQRRLQKGEAAVPRELLREVSMEVRPGEVLAIIGGSGSGKTTLLNVVAGRAGNLELPAGTVDYLPLSSSSSSTSPSAKPSKRSSRPVTPSSSASSLSLKQAKKRIGYVRQTDDLLPYLTVRETLTFSAALRLPRTVSAAERTAIVEQTLMELGLAECADVLVGGTFKKGVSGGERRRLSIGCVLVTMPSILILDEPTTGLDSFTAFQLLTLLDRLAKRGRTIILSIHQPRSDAFQTFDKVLLLSRGSVVYSGSRAGMLPHFASLGHDLPPLTNPLDFVIDISSVDNRSDEAEEESSRRVGELVRAWRDHEAHNPEKEKKALLSPSSALSAADGDVERGGLPAVRKENEVDSKPVARATVWQQTLILTKRGTLNVLRNYGQTAGFFLQATVIGIVLGLVFLNPPETPAGVQSLKTAIYFALPGMFYLSIVVAVYVLCDALVVFDREREDSLYGTVPWVLSTILSYLPVNALFPTIYAIIVYFMAGFRRDDLAKNLFSFIATCIMEQQVAWSYALFAASINRSFAQASLLANGFSIPFVLGSGLVIPSSALPGYIAWIKYFSPYFYGFQWNFRLQFLGRDFACEGVTGPAANQCRGRNVLIGLGHNLNTPLWVFPVGLLAFVLICYLFATILLAFYHPGGVVHLPTRAPRPSEVVEAKKAPLNGLKENRKRVDVIVNNLQLKVRRRNPLTRGAAEDKVILERVNARFPAGEVSVIMGPSGAGKSSLLQLLAGRLSSSAMSDFNSTGSIELNGQPFDPSLASLVAFVEQEDAHHLPALTVRETLRYAARLRLKQRSSAECDARAEEVLRMLGLKACADNMVGGELVKGISGGEKRRLSLAVELLSDPAVLYADEPLSGLDAFTAQNVMNSLRDLAAAGRTVIVSVHQPRSDIWKLFDNVLLLVKGGKSAYSGPTDGILRAFEGAGEKCPLDFNPADFILDVVSVDHRSLAAEEHSSKRVSRIVEMWDKQPAPAAFAAEAPAAHASSQKFRPTPLYKAFPVVLSRSFRNLYRQPDIFVARIANPPFLAILFWLFFLRLGYGPATSQVRIGLLQQTTALPFVGMLACIASFPFEKNLFIHEWRSSARHSAATFVLAYTAQETVISLLSSLIWAIIFVYGMNMQAGAVNFVCFWISSWALISSGESIGIMFSAWTNNGGLAVSLVSTGLTLLAQLNGIISVTLDGYLRVIGWVSPMKPQAGVTMVNEFSGLRFRCSEADISSGACIYSTGEEVLDTFGLPFGRGGAAKYMGILVSVTVLWRIIAWAALRLRAAFL
ncbi:hypothetical protein JCM6882_001645 [Rhodosporidiobolus microsporus]